MYGTHTIPKKYTTKKIKEPEDISEILKNADAKHIWKQCLLTGKIKNIIRKMKEQL